MNRFSTLLAGLAAHSQLLAHSCCYLGHHSLVSVTTKPFGESAVIPFSVNFYSEFVGD